MKTFRILVIALVAMLGFNSCSNDNHDHTADDHSADLVGTWTCFRGNYVEALVIKADGSALSTGVEDGEYWENVRGNISLKNNNITMIFEDDDNFHGHFDIIPGMAFSIYTDKGERYNYNYCPYDLSKDIIGMWVCTNGPTDLENDMMIRTFTKDGKSSFTGLLPIGEKPEMVLDYEVGYKVVGDLVFIELPKESANKHGITHSAERLVYAPNATALGDIMTIFHYLPTGKDLVESHASFLRVNQNLDLSNGKTYEYSSAYVTNLKGKDMEIDFAGQTLNFSKLDGKVMDKMLKNILFGVSFSTPGKISYNCFLNGKNETIDAPIEVDGNKITIKMSDNKAVYRDVDIYAFQDVDGCQMHMYMPTTSYVNFIANISVVTKAKKGTLDLNDAAAVAEVYNLINDAIQSINVSIIFHDSTRSL